MKLAAIDFEFKRPSEPDMGLISAAIYTPEQGTETFWLWDRNYGPLVQRLQEIRETHTLVGYSIQQAEARCLAAMTLDPNLWSWRDLLMEWRWLRNGDTRYSYGRIVKDGRPLFTVPPIRRVGKKASQEELEEAKQENQDYLSGLRSEFEDQELAIQEAGWSMLDCSYFFEALDLDQYLDAERVKRDIRDRVLIRGSDEDIDANRDQILAYNSSDVADLLVLADRMTEAMTEVGSEDHLLAAKGRTDLVSFDRQDIERTQVNMGGWAARLGKYGNRGLPLHRGRLERLLQVVPALTQEIRDSWVREHPETPLYRVGLTGKMLESKVQPLKRSPYISYEVSRDDALLEGIIEAFCRDSGLASYPRTRTGKPDTSKKVIARYAAGENLLKHYERHQGNLSALKTYSERDGRVEALDYIGSDDRQRPDFGPFGTQTARNAAKAKSLCFLGPHWLRTLVDPEPGMAIVELDYGSQEFFIAAVHGSDSAMQSAYKSNDVYMYYAQLVGMYPKDLPIPTEEQRSEPWFAPYKKVRNIAKTLTLSMQFGAGSKSVAAAVRDATKDSSIPDEQGEEWVEDYNSTYADYSQWVQELRETYQQGYGLVLSNGWRMGKDNPSVISASNLPIQGTGSCILMEACRMLDEAGLTVIATLHDAITLYCPETEAQAVAERATRIMMDAAEKILGVPGMKVGTPEIVTHGHLWLHSDRAQAAWNKLHTYFSGTF